MLGHVSLGTNDADRAAAFYDLVLAVLGIRKICERGGPPPPLCFAQLRFAGESSERGPERSFGAPPQPPLNFG